MAFNAKEYLASLQPPTYIDSRGVEHVGNMIPFNSVLPHIQTLSSDDVTEEQIRSIVPVVVEQLGFAPSVADDILSLPLEGIGECLTSFFLSIQGRVKKQN